MTEQDYINYQRIASAIAYIESKHKQQPSLEEIAAQVHLSPFHFQRLFTVWAGVSPKKFLQYISIQYAKQLLHNTPATLFDTAQQTGLSGTGRLHDLFVKIEGMTPGEYKNHGANLTINYSHHKNLFGDVLVASTKTGICYMGFSENKNQTFSELQNLFPKATYVKLVDAHQENALQIYNKDWRNLKQVKLHLKGTAFQLKVWESLLKIPTGSVDSYGNIAKAIQQAKASRAVGTAIGQNPVAFLIPCHRVIQATGGIGGYRWGTTRKTAIIGWEAANCEALK